MCNVETNTGVTTMNQAGEQEETNFFIFIWGSVLFQCVIVCIDNRHAFE